MDLAILHANLGNDLATTRAQGDLDGDQMVTRRDLVRLLQQVDAELLQALNVWLVRADRQAEDPDRVRPTAVGQPIAGREPLPAEIDEVFAELDA
jgi:hypothetical protein